MTAGGPDDTGRAVRALVLGGAPWVRVDDLGSATAGRAVPLSGDAHHHLARVLRRRDGDEVVATDGAGRCAAGTLRGTTLVVRAVHVVPPPRPSIRVVQGVGKRGKQDEVVRMLTEAGVDHVTAVHTARCQADLSHKADRVRQRWLAIAWSAALQARRPRLPVVDGPADLRPVVSAQAGPLLVAAPGADEDPLAVVARRRDEIDRSGWVTCVVGPEGGLDDEELAWLGERGADPVSLGPHTLRTEHAGLALVAVVAAGLGRMGPA